MVFVHFRWSLVFGFPPCRFFKDLNRYWLLIRRFKGGNNNHSIFLNRIWLYLYRLECIWWHFQFETSRECDRGGRKGSRGSRRNSRRIFAGPSRWQLPKIRCDRLVLSSKSHYHRTDWWLIWAASANLWILSPARSCTIFYSIINRAPKFMLYLPQ